MDKIETGVFERKYFTVTTNGKIADIERYRVTKAVLLVPPKKGGQIGRAEPPKEHLAPPITGSLHPSSESCVAKSYVDTIYEQEIRK